MRYLYASLHKYLFKEHFAHEKLEEELILFLKYYLLKCKNVRDQ